MNLARYWSESTPLARVRLYTVATLAVGVILLTIRIAQGLVHGLAAGETIVLLAVVLSVGALGTAAIWLSTHDRNVPTAGTIVWLLLGLVGVYFASRHTDSGTPVFSTTFELLALLTLIVLVLGATKPLVWSVGFSLAAGAIVWQTADAAPSPLSFLGVVFAGYLVGATSAWLYRVVQELDLSRHELASLRVCEERRRFSHDVHDVVGRSLSTIAVKTQLAAALVKRGDVRAETELLEVARVAADAMTETRLLALGYREVDLMHELSGARSLLEHAGAMVTSPPSIDEVPHYLREPMAWVVRESVTNLLRHADARHVTISITPQSLTVWNDGAGGEVLTGSGGSGLSSLSARLSSIGGTITAERHQDEFIVEATFDRDVA